MLVEHETHGRVTMAYTTLIRYAVDRGEQIAKEKYDLIE
jgi:hypothetical protein